MQPLSSSTNLELHIQPQWQRILQILSQTSNTTQHNTNNHLGNNIMINILGYKGQLQLTQMTTITCKHGITTSKPDHTTRTTITQQK
jgi:hypothetical protein